MASCCSYRIFNCHAQDSVPNKLVHFNKRSNSSLIIKPNVELPEIPNLVQAASNVIKQASIKLLDAFFESTFQFVDQPLLPSESNFAPVEEIGKRVEVDIVEGEIPNDFPQGVYVRNGSNPMFGAKKAAKSVFGTSSEIWVEGEAMLHALYLSKDNNGKWTVSYNNRYVQTDTYKLERKRNKPAFLPAAEGDSLAVISALVLNSLRFGVPDKLLSNTNVFEHSGKCYTISENHMPHEIDISTLNTVGDWKLNAVWNRPFTSHPKKAPDTGELVIMGFNAQKPYFEVGILSADGQKFLHRVDLKYNRCTFCHEIGVTQKYNVILDLPLTIDINRLVKGGSLIRFEKDQFARIGVMPRYGDADSVRWFGVETCFVFHMFNCFEEEDEVVVRGCRARGSIIPGPDLGLNKLEWFSRGFKHVNSVEKNEEENFQDGALFSRVHEWRLNMQTGEVKEMNLTGDEFSMDFPMINESYVGIKNKYGYAQIVDSFASSDAGAVKYGGLAKLYFDEYQPQFCSDDEKAHDQKKVNVEYHMLPKNTYCSGAVFVPKSGGLEEDDGWIISFIHNEDDHKSEAYVVDAKKFTRQPVARIALPSRVPYGFHGMFVPMDLQN
ncbi:OLC1v1029040C1 [Oldenlandia corymbosa var. corymbosa]|uniref:OLC1v1029040C1 n=1 Tax=Oldenlandia corymbosa var. corymbosa TaxID=529605 RepID=A0AAV1CEI3_OLDCO|nr:OLC1v1029040C1 [Oldenlandia corymbosa var. corymbosa]